ncbi:hypothetical protein BGZ49_003589, partial [Haplosporangium sp. Z 27]
AFASNRDEFMARGTSRAEFWDVESILDRATNPTQTDSNTTESHSDNNNIGSKIGIISGQDLQPSQAENYLIQEKAKTATGEERITLTIPTKDIPGTWLGITTYGDLVALTNYRETMDYLTQKRAPKLSRGKVCGEFLITMVAGRNSKLDPADVTSLANDQAERWIKKRAVRWDTEFEGLNLLVIQNAGDRQCIGGNREGSELTVFGKTEDTTCTTPQQSIEPGSVVGASNSIFKRPWSKVDIGVHALERVLNKDISLFGTGKHASLQPQYRSHISPKDNSLSGSDDELELTWLVIEMLTLLRVNTKPFPKDMNQAERVLGLRERVFIPRITLGSSGDGYGTRSSTVVLFGRDNRLAVFVEKVWYGPIDEATGEPTEYAPDSVEGLVWWQGLIGQPRQKWRRIEGQELKDLIQSAKDAQL